MKGPDSLIKQKVRVMGLWRPNEGNRYLVYVQGNNIWPQKKVQGNNSSLKLIRKINAGEEMPKKSFSEEILKLFVQLL